MWKHAIWHVKGKRMSFEVLCEEYSERNAQLSIRSMIAYLRASNDAKAVHIDTKGTFDPRTIHENGGTLSSIDVGLNLGLNARLLLFTTNH